jgi:hypothetical protein
MSKIKGRSTKGIPSWVLSLPSEDRFPGWPLVGGGVASTFTNLSAGLKRIYSDETFEYAQNAASPLVELFEEADEIEPEGAGYFWPFMLRSPQNIGTPAEAGNVPPIKQRTEIQGSLNAGQFVGGFEISFLLEAVGTARGTWNKGEVKKHSFDTLRDLVKHRNRIYAGTHGTGRIATVQTTTSSLNTFVASLSTTGAGFGGAGFGALLLRPNMLIDVYTLDVGGASVITSRKITDIAKATRTVTFDGAAASLTAGQHVYIAGSYGQTTVPNGLMGLVDDGEFLDVIHGQSRTTNPELKGLVMRNGGTLRAIDEDLLIGGGLVLRTDSDSAIDAMVMNVGQYLKYIKSVRPTRYQDLAGGRGPLRYMGGTGGDETIAFFFDGRPIRRVVAEDVAPRHVYGIDLSAMRWAPIRRLGWYDHGGGSMFIQGADSGGLKTTRQATMYSIENIGTLAPWAHIRYQDCSDPLLCGPIYGGSDTV